MWYGPYITDLAPFVHFRPGSLSHEVGPNYFLISLPPPHLLPCLSIHNRYIFFSLLSHYLCLCFFPSFFSPSPCWRLHLSLHSNCFAQSTFCLSFPSLCFVFPSLSSVSPSPSSSAFHHFLCIYMYIHTCLYLHSLSLPHSRRLLYLRPLFPLSFLSLP